MTNQTFAQFAALTLAAFSAALTPALAHADEGMADQPTTVARGPMATAAASTDPNLDRGFLLPTAMTQPAGSVTYNNYELLLHGVTYGITDNVQASVTVLSPIVSDMPFVGFGAVKWRLSPTERIHVAAQLSGMYGHSFSDNLDDGNQNIYSLGTGAFVSGCLREDCSSLLSASATYQLAFLGGPTTLDGAEQSTRTTHMIVYGASLVHRVANHVKLLAELTSATGKGGSQNDFDNLPGALASYGVRFHTANLAGDVGFVKPLIEDEDDSFLMGLPFVNISYRWK